MRIAIVMALFALMVGGAARADTEVIELESGEKIEGEVIERTAEKVVLEHATFGRLEVPIDQIKIDEVKKGPPGLLGTSFLEGWHKNIAVGVTGSQGKTKEANVSVTTRLANETDTSRDEFEARYYFSRSEKQTSDNQMRAAYLHDFIFGESRWFLFAAAVYRFEGENDWDHRATANAGIGYQFIDSESVSVRGRFGLGYTRTQGDNRRGTSGQNPEGNDVDTFTGLSVIWRVAGGQTLTASSSYSPILNSFPDFRSRSLIEYKIAIGVLEGLGFTAGGSFDYDSTVSGKNQRDGKFYMNVGYDF